MGFTTPLTASAHAVLTDVQWNASVRDNLQYLKGNAGAVAIGDNVTVGGAGSSWLMITGTSVRSIYMETDQAADEKVWDISLANKLWELRAVNDAGSASTTALIVGRGTGTAIAYVAVPGALTVGAPAPITAKLGVNGAAMVGAGYYNNASPPADGLCVQGSVGIGALALGAPLHIANASGGGGTIFFVGTIADNTPVPLIASGVDYRYTARGAEYISGGLGYHAVNIATTTPGSMDISNDGTNILRFVYSAGALSIQRLGGSLTYDLSLLINYI